MLPGRFLGPAVFLLFLVAPGAPAEEAEPAGRRDLPKERAEWNALFRRDPRGRILPENRLRALRHACEMPLDPSMRESPAGTFSRSDVGPSAPVSPLDPETFTGVLWESVGPLPMRSNARGGFDFGDASGRITALAAHPSNPSIMLLGGATSGIWKSTDGGDYWRPVSDTAPALAISGIAFAASSPNIVYAATGEVDSADLEFRPSRSLGTYLGAGVLKSVDAGDTWIRIDVDLPRNAIVSRVAVHSNDPSQVLVGVYVYQEGDSSRVGGLYRSTDGGVHFSRTFTHAASDLARDPNDSNLVYAAFGVTNGCTSCADSSGVYRSTDFGQTWAPSLVASPATFSSPTGNIKIGVSGTRPTVLYASVLDTDDAHAGGGIFRSTDAGLTWIKRNVHTQMCGAQCSYNHAIVPNPRAPDTLYFGAVDLYKSTDGAQTWKKLTDVYRCGCGTVHVDHHAILVSQSNPATVFFANDGGLNKTTDGGQTFQNLNASLNLSQFNGVALHPTNPLFAMGGTQDNGNQRFNGSMVWSDRTGSDGGFNLIRRDNPFEILSANYFAYMNYSTNGGETFRDVTDFDALMTSDGDPRVPMVFYPPAVAAPLAPFTVFLGADRVFSNAGFGAPGSTWTPRSEAPINDSCTDQTRAGCAVSLEVVGDGRGVIWVGTPGRGVYLSTDGGATWRPRSDGLPSSPTPIVSRVKAVSADGLTAYATLGGFSGLPSRHVFRTLDGGLTWTNVSGNLPDVPVSTIAIDPTDPNDLFVGTDVGVFRSVNGAAAWTSFNQGLPNATVTDLVFHPAGDLFAATYGRGVYRIAAPGSPVGLKPSANLSYAPAPPAPGQSIAFTDRSAGSPTGWRWDFGDATPVSNERNPRHAYAQPGTYPVTLTVTNAFGSSLALRMVTITPGVANPAVLQVPVVLDVFGVPPTHFTSELVAVNQGTASTRLSIEYLPAAGTPGAGGPRIANVVGAGRELRIVNVVEYLRSNGYSIPAPGPTVVGTLRLTFEDVGDTGLVYAGARTATPNPNGAVGGSYGFFAPAVPVEPPAPVTASTGGSLTIYGLREDSAFRSNLALVDVPPAFGGSGSSTFAIQLFDGDTGQPAGDAFIETLGRGEWRQFGSILNRNALGLRNGYARVTKTSGTGSRFLAYGVVNDGAATSASGGTSDGSFILADASAGLVPIVLNVASGAVTFMTELVLTNPGTATSEVTLTYTPSPRLGGGAAGATTFALAGGRQLRIPDVIAFLRDEHGLPLLPGSANQGGTLLVTGALAYARTFNRNPDAAVGGTFGFSYPALAPASRARNEAWVYGLVQNGESRSNLAIADARVGNSTSVVYAVEIFDALGDGAAPVVTRNISLSGGQWEQRSLAQWLEGTGVNLTNAFARIRPLGGASDYVVYGVANDGATAGSRTSDGSYLAMTRTR